MLLFLVGAEDVFDEEEDLGACEETAALLVSEDTASVTVSEEASVEAISEELSALSILLDEREELGLPQLLNTNKAAMRNIKIRFRREITIPFRTFVFWGLLPVEEQSRHILQKSPYFRSTPPKTAVQSK